jgi:hypothetical protein
MNKQIILSPDELRRLLAGEDNVEGYEGWTADVDHDTGSFDSEKGAMYDYEITLYNPQGDPIYKAIDGYYTGPSGDKFYDDITFDLIEEVEGEPEMLVKVVVWYSIQNGGDGSAYPAWFLTEEKAEYDQDQEEGWGESCIGSVETFVGSDIYNKALENDNLDYE